LSEFTSQSDEPWVEETLSHLRTNVTEEPNEVARESKKNREFFREESPGLQSGDLQKQERASEFSQTKNLQEACVNSIAMTVTGKMTVRLNYESENQCIFVTFHSDTILVRSSHGVELRIPLPPSLSKKVI
jgi:hypothetical protein